MHKMYLLIFTLEILDYIYLVPTLVELTSIRLIFCCDKYVERWSDFAQFGDIHSKWDLVGDTAMSQ